MVESGSMIQTLIIPLVFMGVGFFLLIRGGNWTIDSAIYVARQFGLPPLMVGFTIVAFGTSLPELVVSVLANFEGLGGISIGNVVGSNIANIACILAIVALVVPLRVVSFHAMRRDLLMMVGVSALMVYLLAHENITRGMGIGMILLLVAYTYMQYRMAKSGELDNPLEEEEHVQFKSALYAYLFLVVGLIGLAIGAELLVRGAKTMAETLGVPEAIIGLSIIALGTSLPELTTSLVAARKGQSDIVFGNIIGSNVFNILMIIGLTSTIRPILGETYDKRLEDFDVWVMLFVAVVFSALLFLFKGVGRKSAAVFIAGYLFYNGYIYMTSLSGSG